MRQVCRILKFFAFKPFVALFALASVASNVAAERNGAFVGAEIGMSGGGEIKSSYYKCQATDTTVEYPVCSDAGQGSEGLSSDGGVDYGFVAGYKLFVTPYFGLRAYANINVAHLAFEARGGKLAKANVTMLNYGANVDLLGNFVVKGDSSFGGFVGLGIGANTWLGKDLDKLRGFYETNLANDISLLGLKRNITSFDMALNVGLRGTLQKVHGVEIAFRVSFFGSRAFYEYYDEYQKKQNNAGKEIAYLNKQIEANTTIYNPYSILLRYTYSFH